MRCDTKITFVTDGVKTLVTDPASSSYGDYITTDPVLVERWADVTDTQAKTQQFMYGALREGSKTIRLNEAYRAAFDHIRVTDRATGAVTLYDVDAKRVLRHRTTFLCHEVV